MTDEMLDTISYAPPTQRSLAERRRSVLRCPDDMPDSVVAEACGVDTVTVGLVRLVSRMHARDMVLAAMTDQVNAFLAQQDPPRSLTREAVRLLIRDLGLPSRRDLREARNKAILAEPDHLTAEEIGLRYGLTAQMVDRIRGHNPRADRERRLSAALQKVQAGVSIRQAALDHDVSESSLAGRCKDEGVQTHYGRWGALDHRMELIPRLIGEGKSLAEVIEAVVAVEKKAIPTETIQSWAQKHLGYRIPR